MKVKKLLLSFSLLLMATTAWALVGDKFTDANNLKYQVTSESLKEVTLTGYEGDKPTGELTIPATANGYNVTVIGYKAFEKCTGLTSVIIPNGVKSISGSFYGCTGLTSVNIPESVITIGSDAFSGCSGLTSITFHEGLTYIGGYAFYNCTGLTSVTIPNGVTSIGNNAFDKCTYLTSVTIPASITYISSWVFQNCTSLTSVHISDLTAWCNIEFDRYDSNPLYYAHHLYLNGDEITELTIPSDVENVGKYAFESCSSLTSVTIPASVTSIGEGAFEYCSGLTSVSFSSTGLTSIGQYAFSDCSSLTSVSIPASVTSINEGGFQNCGELATLTFAVGSELETIGEAAFYNCKKLTSVAIPAGVTSIGKEGFRYCEKLATLTFAVGSELETIGEAAFENCETLASVIIPAGVTSIGDYAFEYNIKLATLTFADGSKLETIGESAFQNCYVLTSVAIPADVTSIGVYAFGDCDKLGTLTFAEGSKLETIGSFAFDRCFLTSVSIPASVASIGICAFSNNDIETVILKSSPFIGEDAFYNIMDGATVSINLTANSAGGSYWATFYNENYAFQADENTQVFKATLSGAKLTLHEVSDRIVDADTPVILKSTANPVLTMTTTASSDSQENHLTGTSSTITNPGNAYVLNYKSGEGKGVGFYKLRAEGKVGFGKAYLTYDGSLVREFFGFEDDATGIASPLGETEEGTVYNLAGQRIQKMQKGINIVNGQKIIK